MRVKSTMKEMPLDLDIMGVTKEHSWITKNMALAMMRIYMVLALLDNGKMVKDTEKLHFTSTGVVYNMGSAKLLTKCMRKGTLYNLKKFLVLV